MTDRELLELAAKAACMKASEHDGIIYAGFGSREWNPLTDDGDALRLAVKLGMEISVDIPEEVDPATAWAKADHCEGAGSAEYLAKDPYAATRRAIVRAAAAIAETSS